MADFVNILSTDTGRQPINVTYPLYPEVFDRASIEVDSTLKKTIDLKIVTEVEMDSEAIGDTNEVKKLSISFTEGDKTIDATLNKDAFKGLVLILQKIYQNIAAK